MRALGCDGYDGDLAMPLTEEAARQRKEELAACTVGHDAVRDDYMEGIKKHLGRKARRQIMARRKISIWILMFLTRPPSQSL